MKQSSTLGGAALVAVLVWVAGCSANERGPQLPMPAGATNHPWFPIGVGATHEMGKASVDGPQFSAGRASSGSKVHAGARVRRAGLRAGR